MPELQYLELKNMQLRIVSLCIASLIVLAFVAILNAIKYIHELIILREVRDLLRMTRIHGQITENVQTRVEESVPKLVMAAEETKNAVENVKQAAQVVTDEITSRSGNMRRPEGLG